MTSKLKFDLTPENDPCIYFDITHDSDDLRDKVAKRFFEQLGADSRWLTVEFWGNIDPDGKYNAGMTGVIKPVSSVEIVKEQIQDWETPIEDRLSNL